MIGFVISTFTGAKRWLILAAGGVLAVFGIYLAGRRAGAQGAKKQASEKDRKNARAIEDRADAARKRAAADRRPIDERLRDLEGFRDE